MFTNSPFATRLFASFGAAAITLTLLIASFATPQAATFAGLLA